MLKAIQSLHIPAGEPEVVMDDDGIRHVFKVLHGFYGNLFLSKWTTGTTDENGEDQGIANARRIWSFSLREHAIDDIKLALRRCLAAHPEYPPSLPQFVALCDAIEPRRAPRQVLSTVPRIDLAPEVRAQLRAEARRKATEAAHRPKDREPEGLDLLKQAIGSAVGAAGGDECAVLLRLDRDLAPRVHA